MTINLFLNRSRVAVLSVFWLLCRHAKVSTRDSEVKGTRSGLCTPW